MAKPVQKVMVAECPECGSNIRFHNPLKLDQIVVCPECDEELQVVELNPLQLDWANDEVDDDYED